MKPFAFRTLFTLLFSILALQSQANNFYDREEIQTRLEAMDCIVKPRYTPAVESYIKGYFAKDALKAKLVLERTAIYFPIFEKYLMEHNMPEDLKYLAVVESALNPKAVSRVGATGLWQFMKETGAGYGLKINRSVDERSCPHSSTAAALAYLEKAYNRFGSWELAIASYNCGAGNVNRAIRRSGTKDYWKLSRYLPRETRNFVPAFLGAAYMIKYHHLHGVTPEFPHLDVQLTKAMKVHSKIPFETIAAVTGIPVEVVESLNPAFKRDYVPANEQGYYVMLPSRVAPALRDYLFLLRPDNGSTSELPPLPELVQAGSYNPDQHYYQTYYTTAKGDRLNQLGKIFKCSGYNLKIWNNLLNQDIERGQELVVWFPQKLLRYRPFGEKIEVVDSDDYYQEIIEPKPSIPKIPKINPIEPIKLTPIQTTNEPELPFSAMSIADAQNKFILEQKEKQRKKSPIKKIKLWFSKKSLFKKKS